jgi:hypothetical protein
VTRRLQGQPDYIFNFNLGYKNEDLGLFAGLFLNVTGETLFAVGGRIENQVTEDVFQRPLTTLNFTFSKDIGENWKLTFRAEDLTGETRRREFSSGAPFSTATYGTTYSVSLSGEW